MKKVIDFKNHFFTSCPVCESKIKHTGNKLKIRINIIPDFDDSLTPDNVIKLIVECVMKSLPGKFNYKLERLARGEYENVFIVIEVKTVK